MKYRIEVDTETESAHEDIKKFKDMIRVVDYKLALYDLWSKLDRDQLDKYWEVLNNYGITHEDISD